MSTFDEFEVEVDPVESDRPDHGTRGEKGLYKLNINPEKKFLRQKIQTGWRKYGDKIILAIGIILIAGTSFQAGFLKGKKNQNESIVVNQPACAPCPKASELANENESKANERTSNAKSASADETTRTPLTENQKCAYVASKNSNKYHLPTCQFAQKIKPENKICFSSKEEAESRGYQGAKCCIK